MTEEEREALIYSVVLLNRENAKKMLNLDWDDPEDIGVAEKSLRILYAYGRNIEKCIAMTKSNAPDKAVGKSNQYENLSDAELSDLLQRRLLRHADRVGKDELSRRIAEREKDRGATKLALLGPTGSTSS